MILTAAPEQIALIRATDRASGKVDAESGAFLRELRSIVTSDVQPHQWLAIYHQLRAFLDTLLHRLLLTVTNHLERTAIELHRAEALRILNALPEEHLRQLALRAWHRRRLTESVAHLQEGIFSDLFSSSLKLVRRALLVTVFALPIREVMASLGIERKIIQAVSAYPAEAAAAAAMLAIHAGKSQSEIIQTVAAHVQTVTTITRANARQKAVEIATAARFKAAEPLGDNVVGWQVFGILDDRIRPEHRARNKTKYWYRPQPGQLSMDQCPRPPYEADGRLAYG